MRTFSLKGPITLSTIVFTAWSGIGANSSSKESTDELRPARTSLMSITSEEAQRHVDILASDEFEGRESGTKGQRLAAKYLAREFANYNLTAVDDNDDYFQDFHISRTELEGAKLELWVKTDAVEKTPYSLKSDFIPFSFTGEREITAPVVFAGYGITAPEYGYDDYRDLDARGKIVLVLRHEPQEHDRQSRFAGTKLTRHAFFRQKAQNALAHGAVGMLLVTDPLGNHDDTGPEGYWPSLYQRRVNRRIWSLQDDGSLDGFPAAWIGLEVAEQIVSHTGKELADIQEAIDVNLEPASFVLADVKIHLNVDLEKVVRTTQNVLALLEGSHPVLKNEVVVIGAHYDHLGKRRNRIYNGADDNASGTAGILEIAEAYSLAVVKPLRSVLFVAFSGEEMGLLGSEYYASHPAYDLRQTVFMLNLDMIGRNEANAVTVVGSNRSPEVHRINLLANEEIGLDFRYNGEKYFSRSDHANFAKHRIPILFYNTEVHADYHRVTDTAEKINAHKLARISRLAFLVSWKIANSEDRPTFRRFRLFP